MNKSGVYAGAQGIQTLLSTCWNASATNQSASTISTSSVEPEEVPDKKKKPKAQSAKKPAASLESGLEQLSISVSLFDDACNDRIIILDFKLDFSNFEINLCI